MFKEFSDIAVKLSRSPIAIIALAFVLVHGVASLISLSSVFQNNERLILVWFIILFPALILITFYLLVSRHHEKLFGPLDFQNEENFMKYASSRQINKEQAEKTQKDIQSDRSVTEYKILNTLWTKQVNLSPDRTSFWGFKIDTGSPEFTEYRIASSKLIGEGLVGETNEGMLFLTNLGYDYCQKHYFEFPRDQWWPNETIKPENLEKVIKVNIAESMNVTDNSSSRIIHGSGG